MNNSSINARKASSQQFDAEHHYSETSIAVGEDDRPSPPDDEEIGGQGPAGPTKDDLEQMARHRSDEAQRAANARKARAQGKAAHEAAKAAKKAKMEANKALIAEFNSAMGDDNAARNFADLTALTAAEFESKLDDMSTRDQIPAVISWMNARYSTVEDDKAFVLKPVLDQNSKRITYKRLSPDDLKLVFRNRKIMVGFSPKGAPIYNDWSSIWLDHRKRTHYNGIVFDPSNKHASDIFNMWQGFKVDPKPGSWQLLKSHMLKNLCGGNREYYDWLMNWLARMFQSPAKTAETAVVLRGEEGTGKSVIGQACAGILGQHAMAISSSKHLTGKFNEHLQDCIALLAEEAFFAGDKESANALKDVITNNQLTIEPKGRRVFVAPNYLHVIMTSNSEWVVPAAIESRRFFVLDVSNAHRQDVPYFEAIFKELEDGGYSGMLHELLNRDITGFKFRTPPVTEALIEQRRQSLSPELKWYQDVLWRGYVYESKLGLENVFMDWYPEVSTALLYESYKAYNKFDRYIMAENKFGGFMKSMGASPCRPDRAIVGESRNPEDYTENNIIRQRTVTKPTVIQRPHGYRLGSLSFAREIFTKIVLPVEWPTDDE